MDTDITLHGIIPPLVTPLFNDNELDEEGLEKLINKLLKAGVHGIFLLGTTGEKFNRTHRKSCLCLYRAGDNF